MGRKSKGGSNGGSNGGSKPRKASGPTIDKMEKYEDTLQEGGVDDFMFKRDQISFNPQDDEEDDDVNAGQGEEVLGLDVPRFNDEDEEEDDFEDDEEVAPKVKQRKLKAKPDNSTKGRFGKEDVSSDDYDDDEEEDEEESGSEEEEEGWGRQYYSRPSTRRAKEKEDEYDEKREEERDMEEKEVRRLQRRAREALAEDDWGLDDVEVEYAAAPTAEEETAAPVPVPETSDPDTLIRHLQAHEPLKLALARDFPLVLHRLKKTARGIKKMSAEAEGEESLHKGLGWLHYQALLTYATTLAFYIHLCALPASERPDMTDHPILARLLQLKEGVAALEDLDFAAGSVSDAGPELFIRPDEEEDEEEFQAMMQAKRELMARMQPGAGIPPLEDDLDSDEEMDSEEEDEDGDDLDDMDSDDEDAAGIQFNEAEAQALWDADADSMDEDELDDLLADAEAPGTSKPMDKVKSKKSKRSRKKKTKAEESDEEDAAPLAFTPIAEPEFVSSKKKKSKAPKLADGDETMGDPTMLSEADAGDKERKTKSLRFHTSKIAATSARRSAARDRRMGGDDDIPYRDRQAARDAALRKNGPKGVEGEDLDGSDWTESDRKRAREVREEADDEEGDDGYYDLVKRRKTESKEARAAAHDEFLADKFASLEDETADGPRALTRAIEKNRGLTPRRSKTGRNPRVKKKLAYEKAKQKVGSQRAVYKGGQAALSGSYSGEKSGISLVSKSRKF